ncbi:unnamed protein product, partial [Mesorhabditis belari]|uniref:General transcription factor IIF subunit 2 n=1 Tax=Mesorhabditis belari TaxID=2138241 RepID=A0AAF3J3Z8_9BILA
MSSKDQRKRPNVDCDQAKKRVWLVKVPRYLSEIWEANAGTEVGKLITAGNNEVKLKSRPDLMVPSELTQAPTTSVASKKIAPGPSVPSEHTFLMKTDPQQTLAVLAEDKAGLEEESNIRTGKLSVEGYVVQRAECRPPNDSSYLRLKIGQIEKSGQPKRQVIQIQKAAVKFKPVAAHHEDLQRQKAKKEGIKTVRADRDVLRQTIFHAFEKHQYYRLQDLQQLTNQPANYVKEILQEIAIYNQTPPHKSMWELKPEYRNYDVQKEI